MTVATAKSSEIRQLLDPRVVNAVDTIAAAMGFRSAEHKQLLQFIRDLSSPFPKLKGISFYSVATSGGAEYRITYKIKGHPRRTERLGRQPKPAYKRACRVKEILDQLQSRLLQPEEAHKLLYVDATSIERHVEAFERHLASKGSVPRYVITAMTRLRRCIELAGFERMVDIRADALPGLVEKLNVYVDPDSKRAISSSTVSDYLAVLRQFTKWATPRLISADPLVNSGGVKRVNRKKRRDVLLEEVAAIATAARSTTRRFEFAGPDRAMLYLVAFGTGLRAGELAAIQIPWLKLDASPPFIAVPAHVTKTQVEASQPLPIWLRDELAKWLGDRRQGDVWPKMPRDIQPLFDADRIDARDAWLAAATDAEDRKRRESSEFLLRKTSDGEIVFHSLRHGYATQVVKQMDLKAAQRLTRHATASLLADTYAHSRLAEAAAGVERAIQNPFLSEQR